MVENIIVKCEEADKDRRTLFVLDVAEQHRPGEEFEYFEIKKEDWKEELNERLDYIIKILSGIKLDSN
jgi:hypothetical protein